MKAISTYSFLIFLFFGACSEDSPSNGGKGSGGQNSEEWLIPRSEVRDGGPGKDGIPALDDPEFITVDESGWLKENDLVLAFVDGEDTRVYPHPILDWHEIINDKTQNHSLAIIYCPLTGTGIGWNRIFEGNETTFGVSGLLYNSNIIPYDRESNSNWSQLLQQCVNGNLKGSRAENLNLLETTWGTWKKMYPSSKVVSKNTGHSRSYGTYPYSAYRENESLLFSVNHSDNRLHPKERVLSVFKEGNARAYSFEKLAKNNNLIIDSLYGLQIVVTGSKENNLMVAFQSLAKDATQLDFQVIENQLPEVLLDNEGNIWDVFGRAVSGPRQGEQLKTVTQMMGYWFSFAAFYPEIDLYGSEEDEN